MELLRDIIYRILLDSSLLFTSGVPNFKGILALYERGPASNLYLTGTV